VFRMRPHMAAFYATAAVGAWGGKGRAFRRLCPVTCAFACRRWQPQPLCLTSLSAKVLLGKVAEETKGYSRVRGYLWTRRTTV
jgi:hypothetical protein